MEWTIDADVGAAVCRQLPASLCPTPSSAPPFEVDRDPDGCDVVVMPLQSFRLTTTCISQRLLLSSSLAPILTSPCRAPHDAGGFPSHKATRLSAQPADGVARRSRPG